MPPQCENCGMLAGQVAAWSANRTRYEQRFSQTRNLFKKLVLESMAKLSDNTIQMEINTMAREAQERDCLGPIGQSACGLLLRWQLDTEISDTLVDPQKREESI